MIRAGGLWRNEKDGRTYLSGNLGGLRILIFPVREKKGDNGPDYDLCVAENKPREQRDDGPGEEAPPF